MLLSENKTFSPQWNTTTYHRGDNRHQVAWWEHRKNSWRD